jgi:aminomethyltransferase
MLQTALHERHRALGGRLIDFAGWEMPVQYEGILDEHRAVRERAGLFDLSHMGEIWVSGPGAAAGLAGALVSDPPRLADGRAHYSMICTADGGIIDDLIVYRVAAERFMVVPNASNREAVADALRERLVGHDAALDDASLRTSLVAVQGPRAAELLTPLTDVDLTALRYYAIAEGHACDRPALVARTGYTGEDGFELFVDWDDALPVWDALLEAGQTAGIQPCGLGARDTLRLEAGMPLYGNELGLDTNPYEAGLGRVVKLDKPVGFIGRAALEQIAASGPARQLVGLVVHGRGIARHGYPVHAVGEPEPVGVVTSGAPSPTLAMPIAMAYVPPQMAAIGTMVEVAIRAARVEAEIVPLPFYKRAGQ